MLLLREYSTGVPSTRDGMQRPPFGPALSLMGLIQDVASLRTERSAYIDVVAGMSLTSGRERLPVS